MARLRQSHNLASAVDQSNGSDLVSDRKLDRTAGRPGRNEPPDRLVADAPGAGQRPSVLVQLVEKAFLPLSGFRILGIFTHMAASFDGHFFPGIIKCHVDHSVEDDVDLRLRCLHVFKAIRIDCFGDGMRGSANA